jgi:two-component system, OmpR family, sensor histidine kinase KdpD
VCCARSAAGIIWYNIAEIIDRVLQRLAPKLEGHPVDMQVPDDLPLMPVDYVQLEQVLWNLLQNALAYAPPGSPVLIAATQQADSIMLHIGDHGPGIPLDERTRVFEKFYRLPQAQPAGLHGAGLGLAICKGVIEAHGGEIAILDRAGGGTLVTIRLPLEVVDPIDKEQTRCPQPTY